MRDLSGQVAWVTGAGSGIGEAAALALGSASCRVVLSGRRRDALERVAGTIRSAGGAAEVEPLDVAQQPDVAAVAARTAERLGRIDIGVFSAGHNIMERNWDVLQPAGWDSVIRVNLDGMFYCCHAVLPYMREQGEGLIVNISSLAAHNVSRFTGPAYAASKHAVNALTASLLLEERANGVRATAISPGEVNTPIVRFRPEPASEEALARALQPRDLGEIVLFIARLPSHVVINEIAVTPLGNRPATDAR